MDTPTADDVRGWSQLPFEDYGYPDHAETDADPLDELLARATEYVTQVTGREFPTMPSGLQATAREAVQRRVEQLIIKAQEDSVEVGGDFDQVSSWNVTGYSETRRAQDDHSKMKMVNPWPHLHDLLWLLCTDDKKDEWYATWGQMPPAFEISEVDWFQTAPLDSADPLWEPGA